ncbi:MAG: hemerythrin domain-containing protein [Candidatus Omnitrophica bacterium]|nr:hemerythrin domain-containing protein [Candidatus Omnitrophota bacterium]
MNSNRLLPNGFFGLLEDVHTDVSHEVERLEEAVHNLQFEGKASLGRNLKQIRATLHFFSSSLAKHIELEEKVLFPFLGSHIPKLEPVIHLLIAEHEDFKRNYEDLGLFLDSLSDQTSETDRGKMIKKIQETGTYVVYLLKNHLRVEDRGVYGVAEEELRGEEKKELEGAIVKFLGRS